MRPCAAAGDGMTLKDARADEARRWTIDSLTLPRAYLARLFGVSEPIEGSERITSVAFMTACLARMKAIADESYGLSQSPVALGTFGLQMAAAAQGDIFANALKRFASASRILRSDVEFTSGPSVRSGRTLDLSLRFSGARTPRSDLYLEVLAVTIHCGFRWLTGAPLRLAQVCVPAPPSPGDRTTLTGVFLCPVLWRGDRLVLRYEPREAARPLGAVKYQSWAAQELPEFMALMNEAVETLNGGAARRTLELEVFDALRGGARSELEAAARLGVSTATLRRRLAEIGRPFRQIASDMRRGDAERLLATGKTLDEIATDLGYSDSRSLRRACQRWFDQSPNSIRAAANNRSK